MNFEKWEAVVPGHWQLIFLIRKANFWMQKQYTSAMSSQPVSGTQFTNRPNKYRSPVLRCLAVPLSHHVIIIITLSSSVLQRKIRGHELLGKVCDSLNLVEKDYFGLLYEDRGDPRCWIDLEKRVTKLLKREYNFWMRPNRIAPKHRYIHFIHTFS